jgi:hypothetical protein
LVKASVGKKVRFNRKEYDPEALVAHLEELRIVDESRGEVAFKGSLYLDDVVTVLQRAVVFEGHVPERDLTGIVNRALFRAAETGPLQPEPLLGEISRGVQDFLEKPEKEFVLATSLSGFSMWGAPREWMASPRSPSIASPSHPPCPSTCARVTRPRR